MNIVAKDDKDKSMPGLAREISKAETDRKKLKLEGLDLIKHFALSHPKLVQSFSTSAARDALRTRFRGGGCEATKVDKAFCELKDACLSDFYPAKPSFFTLHK